MWQEDHMSKCMDRPQPGEAAYLPAWHDINIGGRGAGISIITGWIASMSWMSFTEPWMMEKKIGGVDGRMYVC